MAKYGRYRDAEDRKADASGKGDSDLTLVGVLLGFPVVMTVLAAIVSPQPAETGNSSNVPTNTSAKARDANWVNSINLAVNNCEDAQRELEKHQDSLGAINNEYWDESVDRQVYLINLRDRLCR